MYLYNIYKPNHAIKIQLTVIYQVQIPAWKRKDLNWPKEWEKEKEKETTYFVEGYSK